MLHACQYTQYILGMAEQAGAASPMLTHATYLSCYTIHTCDGGAGRAGQLLGRSQYSPGCVQLLSLHAGDQHRLYLFPCALPCLQAKQLLALHQIRCMSTSQGNSALVCLQGNFELQPLTAQETNSAAGGKICSKRDELTI